ncbi:cation diffusion facilitator family transporter [Thomasclavelia cocleata]|uniref:Cation diffusion facilitator family transporter n=1 Tax=Thomasclavelia cocleata TaxID=69824 RepID=A0A1I0D4T0_9FIRM|nr:cation diffusion facilitator family transporter [Thomasclavelia cocleata]MCR1960484.1 cation diffusion facilitator family transporter [Thomasclavelia cocleata]NDO42021.1 cation transporter [Thomasclavelia cocleata]SET27257.1 cation diffusion facilitator family transporter [Thomasclavelia cocleata]
MFKILAKKFIKNNTEFNNPKVREQYGTLCSIISIVCNIVLVIFKLTMGAITHSIAIQADGLNNLSDVGSNLASLFGFKLANKHPDIEHPYGHGRIEYVAGLIIAFLILLVGFQALRDSVFKIIAPEKVTFTIVAVIILIVSILIKLWMAVFNRYASKKINSATLLAASQDSLNDVLATLATLISLILSLYTDLPVDGIMGAVVSIIVLKAGIEIFKDTVNPLLGMAPDKELIKELEEYILSYPEALGIHDLMMHDYGPGRKFLTLHVEVDCNDNIMATHDAMDRIERAVLGKYHILTTIHMDPIDSSDVLTNELKEIVIDVVKEINDEYSIHDFRIVSGPTHTNLIFDVLIPSNDQIKHTILKEQINQRLKAIDPSYFTVMQIEHSFV